MTTTLRVVNVLGSDSKINLVLVDTAGRNKEDKSLISEMKKLFAAAQPDHVVYVADGSQGQALRAQMVNNLLKTQNQNQTHTI